MSEYDNPIFCVDCRKLIWRHYLDSGTRRCPQCLQSAKKAFDSQDKKDVAVAKEIFIEEVKG